MDQLVHINVYVIRRVQNLTARRNDHKLYFVNVRVRLEHQDRRLNRPLHRTDHHPRDVKLFDLVRVQNALVLSYNVKVRVNHVRITFEYLEIGVFIALPVFFQYQVFVVKL